MTRDRVIRVALWGTVVLNALGVYVFGLAACGLPSPLLPIEVPPFFAAQLAFVIGLFGGVYAWLALQAEINRPLLLVGALGKLGFFAVVVVYAVLGEVPVGMVWSALPDLVFGGLFLGFATPSAARYQMR